MCASCLRVLYCFPAAPAGGERQNGRQRLAVNENFRAVQQGLARHDAAIADEEVNRVLRRQIRRAVADHQAAPGLVARQLADYPRLAVDTVKGPAP